MRKSSAPPSARQTAEEALGGPVIPLESVIPAGKPQADGAAAAESPPPAATPPTPGSKIGRRTPGTAGGPGGTVMIAGLGEVETKAGLPAFLNGPSPEKRQAGELIRAIRRTLAQQITVLQTALPEVQKSLEALQALGDVASDVAAHEGFDLTRAGEVARELQEAIDRAVK